MDTIYDLEGSCTMTLQFEQRDVTISGWRRFHEALHAALKKGTASVIIDLRNVRYLFSGVLNALVDARVRVRNLGGSLILVADRHELQQFFRSIGFDRMFTIVDDENEARALVAASEAV